MPRRLLNGIVLPLLVFSLVPRSPAAEPEPDPKELPRIPAVSPAAALDTFQIRSGFHLELAAVEPVVADPVALDFDASGRLFVVEMRGYSERREEGLGRVRLLTDPDGDGRFDQSTVFAEGLHWPTAVFCWDGGVFVGATPDLFYFKDTDGDGRADIKQVVFTGFGATSSRLNVQALFNSLRWGLDHRIHGATAGNGGLVKTPDGSEVNLRGRDFSFDPRTLDLRAEGPTAQHGMTFDDWGRKFTCSNSRHIQAVMYDSHYANRAVTGGLPPILAAIPVDGAAAEVFRISPDEPWRIVRTRWRIAGTVRGVVEGGGRVSGYFTAATGVTIYRGDAFPDSFRGNAFIGDAGSNLVHRKRIVPDGAGLKAMRPEDEQEREFLASRDNWFRPVQFANGPDGALYIADMYRETIEHPWSIPESIKQHLDLNSGNDRGRIYRVVPDGFVRRRNPDLASAPSSVLVRTLDHSNAWHRETASRLLYERQEREVVPELESLLSNARSTGLGRLHALMALDGLRELKTSHLVDGLSDSHPAVRLRALQLGESRLTDLEPSGSSKLETAMLALAADPDPVVRFQLAFTLAEVQAAGRVSALISLAQNSSGDPWVEGALLSSLEDSRLPVFQALGRDSGYVRSPAGVLFLERLAEALGRAGTGARELQEVLSALENPAARFRLVAALATGWRAGRVPADQRQDEPVQAVYLEARSLAGNGEQSLTVRQAAVQLLGQTSVGFAGDTLKGMLGFDLDDALRVEIVRALIHLAPSDLSGILIRHLNVLGDSAGPVAVAGLMGRSDRVKDFLQAMEAGSARPGVLTAAQVQALRQHRDPEVRALALSVLGRPPEGNRQQVVDTYLPALRVPGDAATGRKFYQERCLSCHRAGEEGHALGPDLVTMKSTGKEKLLVNILDPNREVAPQYFAYQLETKDGESATGLLVEETDRTVTVMQAFGQARKVNRDQVLEMRSLGQSLMPEGLEQGMTPKQLADLLAFITGL